MAVGVRSYGSSLHMQNVFNPDALPDVLPNIKAFGERILRPEFSCLEQDCGTTIGRRVPIPEVDTTGLIRLETNRPITEQDIIDSLQSGEFFHRVRDTSTCLTVGGFCARCGNGLYARLGLDGGTGVGQKYKLITRARSYQNYVAGTYSGSILGFSTLTSDPLPAPTSKWSSITSHAEMDRLCNELKTLKVNRDEMEYLYTIEDILERALAIIGTYGVYGYA